MFVKLAEMLDACDTMVITMKKKDNKITASIVPKMKDDKATYPPLIVSGTPEELEKGFEDLWKEVKPSLALMSNVKLFVEAAKKVEEEKKTGAKPATTTTVKAADKNKDKNKDKNGKAIPAQPSLYEEPTDNETEEVEEEEQEETQETTTPEPEPAPAPQPAPAETKSDDEDIF